MTTLNYEILLQQLLPIARNAGKAIMEVYQAGCSAYQEKEDRSPVTEADLAAHEILVRQLGPLLPCCGVVSEEDRDSYGFRTIDSRFWLIDPLDGTKEFIARHNEFTVNIALIENGCSVLGVVFAPAIDTIYWGGGGFGSFRDDGDEIVAISVSGDSKDSVCRVVASKSHLNSATQQFIERLGPISLLQAGSSLKICRVAEGEADIYPRLAPTCEWDTAAAQAVLEGAGGSVLSLEGQSLRYGKTDVLNPHFVATRDAALIPR